jgi:hypothetical protein|tara:strand:+ start:363 stop:620 length:258 start_codon:yes stop_codon:yes gene_type:complete
LPKYYVQDGYEQAIVDAKSPEMAAVKAVLHFFTSFVVNGLYVVSEKGFDKHHVGESDEVVIESNRILDLISEERGKNKKKDQDDY